MKQQILLLGLGCLTGLIACKDPVPPEEQVKQRILERWEIRKAGKIDGLYEFLSPAQRQVITRPQYERRFGGAVKYLDATIKEVSCNGSDDMVTDACHAKIYVSVKVNKAGYPNAGAVLDEAWVYEKGNWWIVP